MEPVDYRGKKVAFCTLGCKLNFTESSALARQLEESGMERVDFDMPADLYVVNTCCVTGAGEKSSRNALRRALRVNPQAAVVAVGCYAQMRPGELASIAGVDLVLGTEEKFRLPGYLGALTKRGKAEIHTTILAALPPFHGAASGGDRTRCFVKVQDGCDYGCSYCTVPLARGGSRSATLGEALAAIAQAVAHGFREVVLTGVNIGDFGRHQGTTLTGLLEAAAAIPGLERIRMGSVEPNLLGDDLISLAAASPVIMPHFHLPLQSGSDAVLTLMGRRYTTALFAARVEAIRQALPHAFIGVDMIAGLNGETPRRFTESYRFLSNLPVSQLHAFPYSERPGTRAPAIPDQVTPEEKKLRVGRYLNLSARKLRAFSESQQGSVRPVLFEEITKTGRLTGWTDNYLRVEVPYRPETLHRVEHVKLVSLLPSGTMAGEWPPEPPGNKT